MAVNTTKNNETREHIDTKKDTNMKGVMNKDEVAHGDVYIVTIY